MEGGQPIDGAMAITAIATNALREVSLRTDSIRRGRRSIKARPTQHP